MVKPLLRIDEATPTTRAPAVTPLHGLIQDHYLDHLRTATSRNGRPYSPGTISSYARCVGLLTGWLHSEGLEIKDATDTQTLNRFLHSYLESHDINGTAFVYRSLRNFFRWLEINEELPNPYRSRALATYSPKTTKPKVLARSFIDELVESCHGRGFTNVRDLAIIRLLMEGPRVSEILGIDIREIPTRQHPVLQLPALKGEAQYDRGRRIRIDERAVDALQRYLRVRESHPLAHTTLRDVLWLGLRSTQPLGYNGVRLMLVRRSKRLGYDQHATAHMFRHSFASDYRAAGGSIDDLTEHMGWSSYAMAQRYGKDQAENRAQEARRTIGRLY